MPPLPWDNLSFASKGKMTYGAIICAKLITVSIHQIYVPAVEEIYAALAADQNVDLLGTLSSKDARIDAMPVCNRIYLPAPYVGMFLKCNLTPDKAWSQLLGDIVDVGP